MTNNSKSNISFFHLVLPVCILGVLILYGLILQPKVFDKPAFPLEVVFLLASCFSVAHLLFLGFKWISIQKAIVKKLAKGFPAVLILFAIGLVIGTWIISGTIPMLIFYGIKLIDPSYMYVLAFVIPIIFSTLTGTSWGSVATIGTVLMGVAITAEAHLGITAGAIIGGAYFGDKMSPLSDTTNLAVIASEVSLYGHIKSMMYTTVPSAILSLFIYIILGVIYPPLSSGIISNETLVTLLALESMFNFNPCLLLPPLVILYGSLKRLATLPTLLASCLIACVLALSIQNFELSHLIDTLTTGFHTNMANWMTEVPSQLEVLFNRGGLYELNEVIVFTLMALTFIGTLDVTDAMPTIVHRIFSFTQSKSSLILATLFSTAVTNGITSNQGATSFIIGDAFKKRYDSMKISRKVLSRSIEDYGTMIESLIPWHATSLFMVATLGVSFSTYWHWQFLSLINICVAPIIAILGIGCFYKNNINKESL